MNNNNQSDWKKQWKDSGLNPDNPEDFKKIQDIYAKKMEVNILSGIPKEKISVASEISKLINRVHGIDKQKPLIEGVDYTLPKEGDDVVTLSQEFIDSMRQQSKEKLSKSQGIKEMMGNPIMSSVAGGNFKPNPARKKTQQKVQEQTNTPPKVSEEKKSAIKPEPVIPSVIPKQKQEEGTNKSLEQVAVELYSFLVDSRKDDVKQNKKDEKYRKSLDKTKEKRTKQLIGLFKVKKKKEPPKEETKEEIKKGEEPKTGEKPKTTQKPTSPTTPTTTPKPGAEQINKPSVITPAVKVGIGVGLAGAASSAIGGAESGGNYNITYGDKLNKQKQVVRGSNMSPEQRFGRDLTDLTLEEVDTLGKERNRVSKNTSAMGKYQFMNSTLFGYKDKQGVFRPGLVQRLNLDMQKTKFTPEVQEKLYELFRQDNLDTMQRLGVPLTAGYEYMAHYLGPGGAKAIFDRRNTNMTVQQALKDAGLPDPVNGKTNEELSYLKAADFESILETRLKKHGLTPHAEAKPQTPVPQPLPVESKPTIPPQNKKTTSSSSASVVMLNNNKTVVNGAPQINVSRPDAQDGAKILEKQYN